MLLNICKLEIVRRAKRIDTYLYFILVTLCSMVAVNFIFENSLGPIKENAPYIIGLTMSISSAFLMVIASMITGVGILRDYQHRIESLIFVAPIKKKDYLLGRFLGSFIILLLIASGILWGIILGEYMPWRDAEQLLPFHFWDYLRPFLFIVMPTLFFGGALFFITGALSRKLIVVYTQGIVFFMVYIVAMVLSQGLEDQTISALLDPFSFLTIKEAVRLWTPLERNATGIPMSGIVFYNRAIWLVGGIIALVTGYHVFDFNVVQKSFSKKKPAFIKAQVSNAASDHIIIPNHTVSTGPKAQLQKLYHLSIFHLRSILKEPSFWAIVICAMAIIFINSISLGTTYGVDSYPVTYLVIDELIEMSIFFFLMIMVFFSGEIIWKERDHHISQMADALPTIGFYNLTSKLIALSLMYVVLLAAVMCSGLAYQAMSGYYHIDLKVYFTGLFLGILPSLILYTVLSIFLQVLTNHKYIAHILLIVLFLAFGILEPFGLDNILYTFDGGEMPIYSDMNGYGHGLKQFFWSKTYWSAFCALLLIAAAIFQIRGSETTMKTRWQKAKLRLGRPIKLLGVGALIVMTLSGSYIFYNINILNDYIYPSTEQHYRADYEKTLKQYEYKAQPKVVDVSLQIELYPGEQNYVADGTYILVNKDSVDIQDLHVQALPSDQIDLEQVQFEREVELVQSYDDYEHSIYRLKEPLSPDDSLKMTFRQTFSTPGFTLMPHTQIVKNGTFLRNDHFPTFGYNRQLELKDEDKREGYGLATRVKREKRDHPYELKNAHSGDDGYEVGFEITIGTDSSQIALAPGTLENEWIAGDRRYYHYKMDEPMVRFYPMVSARYDVLRDTWTSPVGSSSGPVDLEIYYHPRHDYNLDRMMASMKASLDYYTQHFSPYRYEQARIMEFPRYGDFAQSLPGTIPYSESMGFILDIDDEEDVDMAYFITAHEMAHQWWGLEVVPANVEGRNMISESLAQYSALMVMKENFSDEIVQKVLKRERNRYLEGRSDHQHLETSLATVRSHKHIHYGKGMLNMYALQDYISEDSVNIALSRFIYDWNAFNGPKQVDRYPTSLDLQGYFRAVTPDSLQYVITDLFEEITMHQLKTTGADYTQLPKGKYLIDVTIEAKKVYIDSLGESTLGAINDWIDIGIYGKGVTGQDSLIYLEKHWIADTLSSIKVVVDDMPVKAGIDPLYKLIDREMGDNVRAVMN